MRECGYCGDEAVYMAVTCVGEQIPCCDTCAYGEEGLAEAGDDRYGEPVNIYDLQVWLSGDIEDENG